MHRHRFAHQAEVRLPQPPPLAVSPTAFLVCPPCWVQGLSPEQWLYRQWVYQWAFTQAQAVVAPSLPERDLLAAWN
jgi:hypothetical protein